MTILEYLQQKYRVDKPTCITKQEAKILGIHWPLRAKWIQHHGKREIQGYQLVDLKIALDKRYTRQSKNQANRGAAITKGGLDVLSSARPAKTVYKRGTVPADGVEFLDTFEWRKVRMQVLKRDGARCACCGATPADGVKMHVDHIKPRKIYPELALDLTNLQVLCEICNHGKGNWDMTDWRAAHA